MPSALGRITVTVPAEHVAKLAASAHAHDRTVAAEVRRALRLYVQGLDRTSVQPAAGSGSPAAILDA